MGRATRTDRAGGVVWEECVQRHCLTARHEQSLGLWIHKKMPHAPMARGAGVRLCGARTMWCAPVVWCACQSLRIAGLTGGAPR